MENKPDTKSNWWQTAPGILTAIAALMTATGGLVLTLNQVGCFDKTVSKKNEVVEPSKENNIDEKFSNKNKDESKTPADSSENKNGGTLSKINDVNFEGSIYKFLNTKLEYYSPEKQLLKFNLNIANTINGVYVSSDLFRLLVGRNIRAPETCTAEWIEQHSSIDAEVTFLIPNDVNAVQLQIGDVNSGEKGTIKIPINFNLK